MRIRKTWLFWPCNLMTSPWKPSIVYWLCSIYTAALNIKCTYVFGLLTLRSFLCASSSCIHVWIQVIKKGKYNRCDKENGNQSHQSNASTISLFFKYMCWIIKVRLFFSVVQYLNECCKASVSNNLFISSTFCQLCRTTNKGNKMKLNLTQTIFP